jgi:hypothetical protein
MVQVRLFSSINQIISELSFTQSGSRSESMRLTNLSVADHNTQHFSELDADDEIAPANLCLLTPYNHIHFLRFSIILCCQLSLLSKVPHLR